jgi:hypothetical protein
MSNNSKLKGFNGPYSRGVNGTRAAIGLLPLGLALASLAGGCGASFNAACEENRTCKPPKGGTSSTDAGANSGGDPSEPAGGAAATGGTSVDVGGTGTGGAPPISDEGGAAGSTDAPGTGGDPNSGGSGGTETDGGAGGSSGTAGSGGSGPVTDKTPPTVVSVSPANNAKGVASNATITVTWSEAMDKASAQAAFQSAELAGKVTFDWPSATVMKVTPSEPLVYAKGKHADLATLAAKAYSLSLNTSAKDAAGNAMAKSYSSKFYTLRQIAWATTHAFCYQLSSTGAVSLIDSDVGVWVGDYEDNSWYRLAVTFALGTIPSEAVGVASASVALPMTPIASWTNKAVGAPFATLGKVILDHIQAPAIDADTLLLTALRAVGDVATSSTAGTKTVDATVAVADDLKNRAQRANRSQFRAEFTKNTDADSASDAVFFGYDSSLSLLVDYLVP